MEGFAKLFIIVTLVAVQAASNQKYYRAAVFENAPTRDFDGAFYDILKLNVQRYQTAAKIASKENVDIIVFSEWGLYPDPNANRSVLQVFSEDMPDPKKSIVNPCEKFDEFKDRPILFNLSCMAKQNNIFVVVNVADYKPCSNNETGNTNFNGSQSSCPEDDFYLFNTNVIFNRAGALIAKYYKRHLFMEPSMNLPLNPENVFFDTDFGRFTTFICFDMLFEEPVKAIEKSGVYNIAYPTFGFDHFPPQYFSTPMQQAWAFTHKVNLLAANSHHLGTGTVGSGIYSSTRGPLVYTNNPDGQSRLLISNVQKSDVENIRDDFKLNTKLYIINDTSVTEDDVEREWTFQNNHCQMDLTTDSNDFHCFALNTTDFKFIQLKKSRDTIESCTNQTCCSLSYEAKDLKETYFFGIYAPKIFPYNVWTLGIEGCFLIRCDSLNSNECKLFDMKSKTVFKRVYMKGNFSTKYVYPFAVHSDMNLANMKQWDFTKNSEKIIPNPSKIISSLLSFDLNLTNMNQRGFRNISEINYSNPSKNSSLLFVSLYGRRFDEDQTLV